MANNGNNRVEQITDEAAQELREFGRQVRGKADDAKKDVVEKLYDVAKTIRHEAREAKPGKEAEQAADNVARGLEKAAHYLKRNSYDDMGDDVERAVKRNPMRSLVIMLVIGVIIGLILRGGGDKT